MAEFIANIGFELESKGLDEGIKKIDKLERASNDATNTQVKNNKKTQDGYNKTNKAAGGLTSTLRNMKGLLTTLGITAFVASAAKFANMAGQYQALNATIKANVDNAREFHDVQEDLLQVARDTRQPLEQVIGLYGGMVPLLKESGFAQEEVVRTAELASKAMKLAGGSAQGQAAAMTQLVQGLGAGVLRGEEFNSVMENAPGLARAMADGFGVPVGALRGMAQEGELTTERVVAALNSQGEAIDDAFDRLPVKASEAWNLVSNSVLVAIGKIDAALGFSSAIASGITSLAGVIERFGLRAAAFITSVKEAWTSFMQALGTATNGPLLWLRTFLNMVDSLNKSLPSVMPFLGKFLGILAGLVALKVGIASAATALGLVGKALIAVKAAALANPVVLIVSALAAAALLIMKNWEPIVGYFKSLWGTVSKVFIDFKNWISNVFEGGLIAGIANIGKKMFKKMADIAIGAKNIIVDVFTNPGAALDAIKNFGTDMVDEFMVPFESDAVPKAAEEFGRKVNAPILEIEETVTAAEAQLAGKLSQMQKNFGVQFALIEKGADAARLLELHHEGLTDAQAEGILMQEKELKVLQKKADQMATVNSELKDLAKTQKLHNIEMVAGKDAANAAALEMKGYSAAQAKSAVETQKAIEFQSKFKDALVDSITNATSIKEAFSNMGDWLKNWLKEQIAHFAANKIMAFLGVGGAGAGGLGGLGSMLGNFFGGGGPAPGTGSLAAAAASATGGAGAGVFGNISSSLSSLATSLGPAVLVGTLGTALGQELGAANAEMVGALAGVGTLLGGPVGAAVGAAIGSAFGGSRQLVRSGIDVGFSGGQVTGQNVDTFERERSLWRGTQVSFEFSDLDTKVEQELNTYFGNLNTSVTSQLGVLGVTSADAVMKNFEVATTRLEGENIEAQVQEWLQDSTRAAYNSAFNTLNPEIQAYIGGSVDMMRGPVQDIVDIFENLAASTATVSGIATALNLTYDGTAATAPLAAQALTDLMGGIEQLTGATNSYYETYFSNEERQQLALAQSATAVEAFRGTLTEAQNAAIQTDADFRKYVEGLDLQTESGRLAFAQAMSVAGAFHDVTESTKTAQQILAELPASMQGSVTQMRQNAQSGFQELADKSQQVANAHRQAAASYGMSAAAVLRNAMQVRISAARATRDANIAAGMSRRAADAAQGLSNLMINGRPAYDNRGNRINYPHFFGKEFVPYDDYPAILHKGEAVLTAREASEYRASMQSDTARSNNSVASRSTSIQSNSQGNDVMMGKVLDVLRELRDDGRINSTRTINAFNSLEEAAETQTGIARQGAEANDRLSREIRRRNV